MDRNFNSVILFESYFNGFIENDDKIPLCQSHKLINKKLSIFQYSMIVFLYCDRLQNAKMINVIMLDNWTTCARQQNMEKRGEKLG